MKMLKNLFKNLSIFALIAMFVLSLSTNTFASSDGVTLSATDPCALNRNAPGCKGIIFNVKSALGTGGNQTTNLAKTISLFGGYAVVLIVSLSVLILIYGAYQYLIGKPKEGKATITNAIIGLVIAVLSFGIVSLVAALLSSV